MRGARILAGGTYTFQAAMYNIRVVKIFQTFYSARELRGSQYVTKGYAFQPTSLRWLPALPRTYSTIFPLAIHSETIENLPSSMVSGTPIRLRTLGWDKFFHMATSLQKRCKVCEGARMRGTGCYLTLRILALSSASWTRKDLTATSFPLYTPFRRSANPPKARGISERSNLWDNR